jgi:hypothetical protein
VVQPAGGGVVVGGVLGDGPVDGGVEVGGVEVGGASPLQETPLRAKDVGAGLLPEYVAWKPKLADAPVPRFGLWDGAVAVTVRPDWVSCAFQPEVTCWLPVYVQVTTQPVTGAPLLVTLTSAVKPVLHWLAV